MATLDPSIAPLADAGLDPLVGMWTGAPASQAVTVVDHAAPALSLSEKFATAHLPACNCAACSGATHPVSSELSSSPSPDGTALTALDAQYLYNTPQPATNAVLSQQAAYQWHGAAAGQALVINYTFATQFPYGYDSTFSSSTWSVFSASEQAAVRQILGLYSQVANITFNEVSYNHVDPAAMMFGGNVNMPGAAAVTYLYGSTHLYYADVFVDDNYNHPAAGNYDYLALIHEIGHALGLKHPGNYNAGGGGADGPYLSSYGLADTRQYTVMSYNGHASYGSVEPLTPQLLDVAAVQYLYGANTGFHSGNDTYTFSTSPQIMTIWDGGGIDTFDASNETSNSRIDLNPGAFSSIGAGFGQNNIAIAYGASIENAIGGSGNDSILGNSLANSLAGGGGNDSLAGIGGDDELYGGAGADSLDGGDGNDYLEGGVGADALIGGGGYDTAAYRTSAAGVNVNLSTGAGSGGDAAGDTYSGIEYLRGSDFADTLAGDANNNWMAGYDGNDSLAGNGGDDWLLGGAGNDTIEGGDGSDGVFGDAGNDELYGGAGNDQLYGGDGNDYIEAGAGADALFGGNGYDTAAYRTSPAGVNVNLLTGVGSGGDAQGDTYSGVEYLRGSDLGDTLTGDHANNWLAGYAGDDSIAGNGGDDWLLGGAGNDTIDAGAGADGLFGEAGNDVLFGGTGNDSLDGGDGNDTIEGGAGADTLIGGDGIDLLSYAGSAQPVSVNFLNGTAAGGDAAGDSFSGFESAAGSAFADTLTGDNGRNVLFGNGGDDVLAGIGGDDELYGGAGADSLDGGDGNDYLEGGVGADALIGGGGYDTAAYRTSAAGVNVNLSTGAGSGGDAAGDTYSGIEYLRGSDFADTLAGDANNNWMAGYDGNDSLAGNGGDDWLLGGAGNDTIEGGDGSDGVFGDAGNDELYGGAGNDQLYGGDGNDTLYGGSGADTLVGGAGTDTAVFAGSEAAYAIAFSNGSFSLTEAGTLVILRDIEFARFTDGTLDLTGFA